MHCASFSILVFIASGTSVLSGSRPSVVVLGSVFSDSMCRPEGSKATDAEGPSHASVSCVRHFLPEITKQEGEQQPPPRKRVVWAASGGCWTRITSASWSKHFS